MARFTGRVTRHASVALVDRGATLHRVTTRGLDDTPSERAIRLSSIVDAFVAVAIVVALLVVASIVVGVAEPSLLLALQGALPHLLLVTMIATIVAALRRRRVSTATGLVATVALLALGAPAATADDVPTWTATAPTIHLYAANIRFDNERMDEAFRSIARIDADVLVLNEVEPQHLDQMRAAGVFRGATAHQYVLGAYGFGELVISRVDDAEATIVEAARGARIPAVSMRIGGRAVEVWAVHPDAPSPSSWDTSEWRRQVADLGDAARRRMRRTDVVLAGDFNGAIWNPPLQDLLDVGLADAHDERGAGLSNSWSPEGYHDLGGKLIRLDHCLHSPGLFPTGVRAIELVGSDHTAMSVTLAVRRSGQG